MNVYQLQKDGKLSKSDRDEVVSILNNHGIIVMPTDTSYGLAAKIDDEKALKKLVKVKGREKGKTMSIVVKGQAQALKYGVISCNPKALWKAFLPGPLTLVVWSKVKKLPLIRREDNTLAIRFVPTPVVNQILRAIDTPVTITSANRGRKTDVYSLDEFKKQYKNGTLPEAFIDAGKLKKQKPSTIVSALKGEKVIVLRKGPVSEKQIKQAIKNSH